MEPPVFGGKAGDPVPQVDPHDLKIVYEFFEQSRRESEGRCAASGSDLLRRLCKPDANIEAVAYRATMLSLMIRHQSDLLPTSNKAIEACESVYHAGAQVPMQWMGVGVVHHELPFDLAEFLRLCDEPSGNGK